MHRLKIVLTVGLVSLVAHFAWCDEPSPEVKQAMDALQQRTDKLLQSGSPLLATHKGMLLYLPVKASNSIIQQNKMELDVRNREAVLAKALAETPDPALSPADAAKKQATDVAAGKRYATAAHTYLATEQANFATTMTTWTGLVTGLEAGKNVLAAQTGRFEWAYYSKVDGSGQPIIIQLPDNWDGKTPGPVVVSLHGYVADHTQEVIRVKSDVPHFELNVNGRGSSFYRLMGEDDVLEALDFLEANYPIDPDRVYLYGWSMGGWGCNLFATRHTDRFAGVVAVSGWAFGLPVENMLPLPVQFYAGETDPIIPISTMRVQMLKLNKAGAKDISLLAYPPPSGHDTYPISRDLIANDPNKPLEFLFQHRRNSFPEHLLYTTDLTFPGNYYWLNVDRLLDAHAFGHVDLTARNGLIQGTTSNIERMQISALNKWLTSGRTITLDGQAIAVPDGLDKVTVTRTGGNWAVQQNEQNETAPVYHAGGMFAIGDGQPIKLVAPDNWESNSNLKRALNGWRSMGNLMAPHVADHTNPLEMVSWLPVTLASDPSLQKADSHLILVGGPDENPIVQKLLPSWPVTFDDKDKTVTIKSLGTFPKDKVAIELNYYNPQNPKVRTIWLYHQSETSFPVHTPIMVPPSVNSMPDICVQNIENGSKPYVLAAANFGNDWVLPDAPKNDPQLPGSIKTLSLLETALARAARDDYKADAFFTGPSTPDESKEIAIGRLTLSSLRAYVPNGLGPLVRATLTQAQLKDLQAALQQKIKANETPMVLEFATPDAANKNQVSIIFGDSTVWELSRAYHYNFPDGTLEYVGKDLYDLLDRICAP